MYPVAPLEAGMDGDVAVGTVKSTGIACRHKK